MEADGLEARRWRLCSGPLLRHHPDSPAHGPAPSCRRRPRGSRRAVRADGQTRATEQCPACEGARVLVASLCRRVCESWLPEERDRLRRPRKDPSTSTLCSALLVSAVGAPRGITVASQWTLRREKARSQGPLPFPACHPFKKPLALEWLSSPCGLPHASPWPGPCPALSLRGRVLRSPLQGAGGRRGCIRCRAGTQQEGDGRRASAPARQSGESGASASTACFSCSGGRCPDLFWVVSIRHKQDRPGLVGETEKIPKELLPSLIQSLRRGVESRPSFMCRERKSLFPRVPLCSVLGSALLRLPRQVCQSPHTKQSCHASSVL